MCNQLPHRSPSVVTFMANSMIYSNYSGLVNIRLLFRWRNWPDLLYFYWRFCGSRLSFSWNFWTFALFEGETSRQNHSPSRKSWVQVYLFLFSGKLQLFMVSMMKSTENMEILTPGSIAPKFSTICPWVPLLTTKYSVSMEDLARRSKLLIKWGLLIEKYKFLMKGRSVTWCGPILKILKIGLSTLEVQAGFSGQRSPMISAISMVSVWLPVLISLSKKDINFGSR